MELLELVMAGTEAHVSLMAALSLKLATAEHTTTKRNSSGLLHRSNCGMIAVTLSGRTYRRRSRLVLYDHPRMATVIQRTKHPVKFCCKLHNTLSSGVVRNVKIWLSKNRKVIISQKNRRFYLPSKAPDTKIPRVFIVNKNKKQCHSSSFIILN
jgi:hypothetical protein